MQILNKQFVGLMTYLITFVISIPYFLIKGGYYDFLEVYMPNVDLIANLLTQIKGPKNIWSKLYLKDKNAIEMTTTTLINYISLLGIVYLVSRETYKEKSICSGFVLGTVMGLITYLLPAPIVDFYINKFHKKIKHIHPYMLKPITIFIIGSILTLSFIFTEMFILKNYRHYLSKLVCKYLLII